MKNIIAKTAKSRTEFYDDGSIKVKNLDATIECDPSVMRGKVTLDANYSFVFEPSKPSNRGRRYNDVIVNGPAKVYRTPSGNRYYMLIGLDEAMATPEEFAKWFKKINAEYKVKRFESPSQGDGVSQGSANNHKNI